MSMRATTRALIAGIPPLDDTERYTIAWALQWIDAAFPLWRTNPPASPPVHLISYVVPVDERGVLLGAHRLSGLWLPCGGHVEPDEHPRDAAMRELHEELGIEAIRIQDAPVMISRHTIDPDSGHTDVALWFAVRGDREQPLTVDPEELAGVRWFQLDALPDDTDPALPRFLTKLAMVGSVGS